MFNKLTKKRSAIALKNSILISLLIYTHTHTHTDRYMCVERVLSCYVANYRIRNN